MDCTDKITIEPGLSNCDKQFRRNCNICRVNIGQDNRREAIDSISTKLNKNVQIN